MGSGIFMMEWMLKIYNKEKVKKLFLEVVVVVSSVSGSYSI